MTKTNLEKVEKHFEVPKTEEDIKKWMKGLSNREFELVLVGLGIYFSQRKKKKKATAKKNRKELQEWFGFLSGDQ
jgi:formylmethanofuran dehydrogenase subunit B